MELLTTPNWIGSRRPPQTVASVTRFGTALQGDVTHDERLTQLPSEGDHVGSQSVSALPLCSGEATNHATGRKPLSALQGS